MAETNWTAQLHVHEIRTIKVELIGKHEGASMRGA